MIEFEESPNNPAGTDPLETIETNATGAPVEGEPCQTRILGKPVYWVDTPPINENSGFIHKRLCDGLTFTAGTACAYSCEYCYVLSQVLKQEGVRNTMERSGLPFNKLVIRRQNILPHLAQQLTAKKRRKTVVQTADQILAPELIQRWGLTGDWSLKNRVLKYVGGDWDGKVIFGSPFVDIAATSALVDETIEMCEMILRFDQSPHSIALKKPVVGERG